MVGKMAVVRSGQAKRLRLLAELRIDGMIGADDEIGGNHLPRVALESLMQPVSEETDARGARRPQAPGRAAAGVSSPARQSRAVMRAAWRTRSAPFRGRAAGCSTGSVNRAGSRRIRDPTPGASRFPGNRPARRATDAAAPSTPATGSRSSAAGTATGRTAPAAGRQTRGRLRSSTSTRFDSGSGDRLINARVPALREMRAAGQRAAGQRGEGQQRGIGMANAPAASMAPPECG